MTRSEKWSVAFAILDDYEVSHSGSSLGELTEYIHQSELGRENYTILDALKEFDVHSEIISRKEMAKELAMIYQEEEQDGRPEI